METKRIDYIDLLKAIAIYFVILYHFNRIPIDFFADNRIGIYFNYFLTAILSAGVPIFFFENGMLLLSKDTLDIKRHTIKIIRIIFLYLIWGAITLIALSFILDEKLSLSQFFYEVIYLKENWNNHLWFLKAMIIIYIFFPLIFTAFKMNRKAFYFFLGCVALLTFGITLLNHSIIVINFILHKFSNLHFEMSRVSFNPLGSICGFGIGYFLFGGLFYKYKDFLNTKKIRMISIGILPLSMLLLFFYSVIVSMNTNRIMDIVWSNYDSISTQINVIAIFIIAMQYKSYGLLGKLIKIIGKNSLGIFLIHRIIGYPIMMLFDKITFSNLFFANAILTCFILLGSLAVVVLLKKTPVLKQLFII
jgi:surface polysaccharide O-acyltransferase-like enzyme